MHSLQCSTTFQVMSVSCDASLKARCPASVSRHTCAFVCSDSVKGAQAFTPVDTAPIEAPRAS